MHFYLRVKTQTYIGGNIGRRLFIINCFLPLLEKIMLGAFDLCHNDERMDVKDQKERETIAR